MHLMDAFQIATEPFPSTSPEQPFLFGTYCRPLKSQPGLHTIHYTSLLHLSPSFFLPLLDPDFLWHVLIHFGLSPRAFDSHSSLLLDQTDGVQPAGSNTRPLVGDLHRSMD